MIIKIDNREQRLLYEINNREIPKDCTVICKKLELGDVVICDNNDNEILIIERKTLKDLGASIKDGRYKEQSFRLNQCSCHNHNIIYLIEGLIPFFKEGRGITKNKLRSAILELNHFKGFTVLKTPHINESAEFILQIANKLQNTWYKGFYCDGSKNVVSYSEVTKRTKKCNVTPKNIGEIMLSQIPKVSVATSRVIMKKYKTMSHLIEALKANMKCLDDLKLKTKTGKERKISKPGIKNIIAYLL